MNWPLKPLGNFLSESRIISTNPAVERRIRVRLNAEGVEKRPVVTERKGVTRYFIRRSGQFIYGKQNLHKGAFGVIPNELDRFESSSDLPAFDVSEAMRPKWIEYFFKQGNCYQTLVSIAKGAATKRIQPQALFGIHIPSPPIHIQDELIYQMDACCSEQAKLLKEIAHQETLLAQLKQAILHEAVQGKLTADWRRENPDVEPASQLLERIRGEKQRLVAKKKIRREKPLPPIAPEEIPFEIPEGWAWCRLGDLCEKTGSGSTPRGGKTAYVSSGIPFLRSQNVHDDGIGLNGLVYIPEFTHIQMRGSVVYPRDVLLNITGGSIGRSAIVHDEFDEANINQHVSIIRPVERDMGQFVHKVLLSPYFQRQIIEAQTGSGREGLPKNKMDRILIPVPSQTEQVAIIERVESLLASCRQLETEIGHSRAQAENLLQAVLKEAFTPKTI